jgi:hypothetical protein
MNQAEYEIAQKRRQIAAILAFNMKPLPALNQSLAGNYKTLPLLNQSLASSMNKAK